MKKQVVTMMAVLVFFAALAVTSIQAQNAGNMSVSIPFDFAVSGKTLPAGEYYVLRSTEDLPMVTQIRSRDNTKLAYFFQTHPVDGREIQRGSKLVFNKYGDQFFLSQVWILGRRTGEELPKSSKERARQREMIVASGKAESVEIAGKSN